MSEETPLSRRDLFRAKVFGRAADAARRVMGSPGAGGQAEPPAEGAAKGPGSGTTSGTGRRFALPIHRPPGAVDEVSFLAGCTRCGECIKVCPVQAITLAPARFREAAGTPMIDAHVSACVMCADTPCITACGPGVLRADQPRKMGVAWIQNMACLAYTGSFCTVCSERCPVSGAIEVTKGKPRIREDVCTGCGVCAAVCPAPSNAVVLMPLADRPPCRPPAG